jgi:hypothetical protein
MVPMVPRDTLARPRQLFTGPRIANPRLRIPNAVTISDSAPGVPHTHPDVRGPERLTQKEAGPSAQPPKKRRRTEDYYSEGSDGIEAGQGSGDFV